MGFGGLSDEFCCRCFWVVVVLKVILTGVCFRHWSQLAGWSQWRPTATNRSGSLSLPRHANFYLGLLPALKFWRGAAKKKTTQLPSRSTTKSINCVIEPSQQIIVSNNIHHICILSLYYLEVQQLAGGHVFSADLIAPGDDNRFRI